EPTNVLRDLGMNYDRLVVVENTPDVHNVVVCTLCSCYPWDVMGLPPTWYKTPAYRSRAVVEPRKVLAEFGIAVPESREVRVWDGVLLRPHGRRLRRGADRALSPRVGAPPAA